MCHCAADPQGFQRPDGSSGHCPLMFDIESEADQEDTSRQFGQQHNSCPQAQVQVLNEMLDCFSSKAEEVKRLSLSPDSSLPDGYPLLMDIASAAEEGGEKEEEPALPAITLSSANGCPTDMDIQSEEEDKEEEPALLVGQSGSPIGCPLIMDIESEEEKEDQHNEEEDKQMHSITPLPAASLQQLHITPATQLQTVTTAGSDISDAPRLLHQYQTALQWSSQPQTATTAGSDIKGAGKLLHQPHAVFHSQPRTDSAAKYTLADKSPLLQTSISKMQSTQGSGDWSNGTGNRSQMVISGRLDAFDSYDRCPMLFDIDDEEQKDIDDQDKNEEEGAGTLRMQQLSAATPPVCSAPEGSSQAQALLHEEQAVQSLGFPMQQSAANTQTVEEEDGKAGMTVGQAMLGHPGTAPGALPQGRLAVAQQQPGIALLPDEDGCPLVFDIESDYELCQTSLTPGDTKSKACKSWSVQAVCFAMSCKAGLQ